MKFTGQLNDKMAGFYRSTYKNSDGSQGILATTQMEPTDARRAFPCFDEPALKAEFTITLIADKKHTCLSNMDVASETEISGTKKAVKFNKSPNMSTYLVAFIVGELNYIETDKFRLPIRVYAPPNQDIEHGRFSLELAARTLEFYEKTFDSKFPLPKMVSSCLLYWLPLLTGWYRTWLRFLISRLGKLPLISNETCLLMCY
jgi:aminopeptidase 2